MMNQSMLKQLYDQFLLLPFPHVDDQEEALTDWMIELAEIDSYYAGLTATLMMNKPVQMKKLPSLKPLFESLNTLRHQSSISENQYQMYEHYLLALDKLAKGVEEYLNTNTISEK
jgi:hypothetical protein